MFALLFILSIATTTIFSIQGMEIIKSNKQKNRSSLLRKKHSYSESHSTNTNQNNLPTQHSLVANESLNKINNTNQINLQPEHPVIVDNKSNSKKLRKSYSNTTGSNPITNTNQICLQTELPFILAIKSNHINKVKNCLTNPYFNPNKYYLKHAINTCLENKHYDLLPLLFKDPRIDISIQIKDLIKNLTAIKQEQLQHDKNGNIKQSHLLSEVYRNCFSRMHLDVETNKICDKLKLCNQQGCVELKIVQAAAEKIKQNIIKVEEKQSSNNEKDEHKQSHSNEEQQNDNDEKEENDTDRKIPKTASFPDYADLEFRINKIWFNLSTTTQ